MEEINSRRSELLLLKELKNGEAVLPPMMRLSAVAALIGTTSYYAERICESEGIHVVRAGPRKIRMIPTKNIGKILWQKSSIQRQYR